MEIIRNGSRNSLEFVNQFIKSKRAGVFSRITYMRPMKTKRNVNDNILKVTSLTGRLGIKYENMKVVKDSFKNTLAGSKLEERRSVLPWGVWSLYPYLIAYNGNNYLRVSMDKNNKPTSIYYKNGKQITKEEAKELCVSSEFRNSEEAPKVFNVNVNNIISLK